MLQEIYADQPWRLIVACILLNQTTRTQVDRVRDILFRLWPDARAMADASHSELVTVLHPLGFQHRRADRLIAMSRQWVENERKMGPRDWDADVVADLPGVGDFALDSYRIFHLNDFSRCDSSDKEIMAWLARQDLL